MLDLNEAFTVLVRRKEQLEQRIVKLRLDKYEHKTTMHCVHRLHEVNLIIDMLTDGNKGYANYLKMIEATDKYIESIE